MTTVFHAWPYGRFIEIKRNLWRKKLHITNPGSNFLGGSLTIAIMLESQSNFEEKVNPSILKDYFFLKNRPIHFHINIASVIRLVK